MRDILEPITPPDVTEAEIKFAMDKYKIDRGTVITRYKNLQQVRQNSRDRLGDAGGGAGLAVGRGPIPMQRQIPLHEMQHGIQGALGQMPLQPGSPIPAGAGAGTLPGSPIPAGSAGLGQMPRGIQGMDAGLDVNRQNALRLLQQPSGPMPRRAY